MAFEGFVLHSCCGGRGGRVALGQHDGPACRRLETEVGHRLRSPEDWCEDAAGGCAERNPIARSSAQALAILAAYRRNSLWVVTLDVSSARGRTSPRRGSAVELSPRPTSSDGTPKRSGKNGTEHPNDGCGAPCRGAVYRGSVGSHLVRHARHGNPRLRWAGESASRLPCHVHMQATPSAANFTRRGRHNCGTSTARVFSEAQLSQPSCLAPPASTNSQSSLVM